MHSKKTHLGWLSGFLGLIAFAVNAEMTVEQHLSFGEVAIVDNSQPASLRVLLDGRTLADEGIVVIEPGHPGQYLFYDYPPNTNLSMTLSEGDTTATFSGGSSPGTFRMEPYLPFETYRTDQFGELTLVLPANLHLSGDGSAYLDGQYYRYFQIYINY
ncbi:MAG: hypothetical protein RI556_12025 [Hydrogenovibrio sp.]|uniref:hypothetical protein n=1 Tax=Hydrogenovibrio sp. TaxID=2065821 RepID=UPI00286FEC05|nr:hypothetical protein [Hydrogenovibrio sp.]MDR9499895.1 hypothetical protein [Hydrogenovibrio sp.]